MQVRPAGLSESLFLAVKYVRHLYSITPYNYAAGLAEKVRTVKRMKGYEFLNRNVTLFVGDFIEFY